jgi:DNA polymerase (family 10)
MAAKNPTNAEIADILDRIAELLDFEDSNPFRVNAYRTGASTIRGLKEPVAKSVKADGLDDLIDLPNIGTGIAAVVGEFVTSGRSALLDDLESKAAPGAAFLKIPGIGREMANRIVDELHIRTLAELEDAAHDGRLASVQGFGEKRVEGVKTALAGLLSRSAQTRQRERTSSTKQKTTPEKAPPLKLLLEIDEDYRKRAKKGDLHKIAPRRFNPDGKAWLPVMNEKRGGWDFTAMFSNTAQAHKLNRTDDWVVIYFERDGREGQHTVVTETRGPLEGRRVVRGRDAENRSHYQAKSSK